MSAFAFAALSMHDDTAPLAGDGEVRWRSREGAEAGKERQSDRKNERKRKKERKKERERERELCMCVKE